MTTKVKPFQILIEGKPSVVFVSVNELGQINYDGTGVADGWSFESDPNVEIPLLVGQQMKPIKTLKELSGFIDVVD